MKTFLHTIFLVFIILAYGTAQSCFPNGIGFLDQKSIDLFPVNYPDCTEIEGNLFIGNLPVCDISNLNGLNSIISIGGTLTIAFADSLTSLAGLENLTTVGKYFEIRENNSLTSFSGLGKLSKIGKSIYLIKNSALTEITGLQHVTTLGESIYIYDNDALTSLDGLNNIAYALDLNISNNASLSSLSGLENIKNLDTIWGGIQIRDNGALTSLSGIDSIDFSNLHRLIIVGCPNLSTCAVKVVCDYLESGIGAPADISANSSGCNSVGEVEAACSLVSVEDLLFSGNINVQISPNPTSGNLEIRTDTQEPWILSIVNVLGNVIRRQPSQIGAIEIDIADLPSGLYYLEIICSGILVVKRIYKK